MVAGFRLHNVFFKYPILEAPKVEIVWRKVELANWTQLIGTELGLRVRKNTDSIEVVAPVVEGRDPYELLFKAREEADFLAAYLERKFGMVFRARFSFKEASFRHFRSSYKGLKQVPRVGCGECQDR